MDPNEHSEGHPDADFPGNEWLRVMEGFLEPERLTQIIVQNQQLMLRHSKTAQNLLEQGRTQDAFVNQMISGLHLATYHNAMLQIGVVKRLDAIGEILDQILQGLIKGMDNGDEDWKNPPPEEPDPEDDQPPPMEATPELDES